MKKVLHQKFKLIMMNQYIVKQVQKNKTTILIVYIWILIKNLTQQILKEILYNIHLMKRK
jgi:hypothetical protein